jgi:hypothetical protein
MAITEYKRNVGRAVPKTVFENTVRRAINVWRLVGDTLNITCNLLYCNHQVHRDFDHSVYYVDLVMAEPGECVCVVRFTSYTNDRRLRHRLLIFLKISSEKHWQLQSY